MGFYWHNWHNCHSSKWFLKCPELAINVESCVCWLPLLCLHGILPIPLPWRVNWWLLRVYSKAAFPQSAGFEPARAEPNRFLVCRLNHSAMTAYNLIYVRGPAGSCLKGHLHMIETPHMPRSNLLWEQTLWSRIPGVWGSIPVKIICQKWDSNPRLENQTATWTQRLRPLGHPDFEDRHILTLKNLK